MNEHLCNSLLSAGLTIHEMDIVIISESRLEKEHSSLESYVEELANKFKGNKSNSQLCEDLVYFYCYANKGHYTKEVGTLSTFMTHKITDGKVSDDILECSKELYKKLDEQIINEVIKGDSMILYYNIKSDELDDWHKVIVKKFELPNSIVLNCDEKIPSNIILCDSDEQPVYVVRDSKHYIGSSQSTHWKHRVEEMPKEEVYISKNNDKLIEELESFKKEPEEDTPPEEIELDFDEQIEEDLTLYGMAYYTVEDGYKKRIAPFTVVALTRTRK